MVDAQIHKYIQVIIKGIRECLISPSTTIKDDTTYKFTSLNHQKFTELRLLLGITNENLLDNLTDEYIIKHTSHKRKRIIFYNSYFNLVIKSIKRCEKDFILSILPSYADYVSENHDTLLTKIFMCVSISNGSKKSYVIVMNNILPYEQSMYELYDLKGSTYNRISNDSTATLKDLDWMNNRRKLFLQGKRVLLKKQIICDCNFLESLKIIDYSIIIGIQNGQKKLCNMYKKYSNGIEVSNKYEKKSSFNNSIFFRDFDGYSSEIEDTKEVYFIGIIDFLTHWTWMKRLEKLLGDFCCKNNISCVNPKEYKERFIEMVENGLFYD